jgi:tetratricopeptide (TPR) repeat protein
VSHSAKVSVIAGTLACICLTSSILVLRGLDRVRTGATLQEFLYISSPKLVKHVSLGYEGLLADIYWTRAVQYYGGMHHTGGGRYELLWPLLNITTQLDPHIIPAYEYGATFLTEKPPAGAGVPEKAVQLMEYGIRNNPNDWHLYYDLAYIYYLDLKDYPKAADAFLRGSKVPNAHPFMKLLAAQAAQHGGELETAEMLWASVLETTHDKDIRENAVWHLRALQADHDSMELEKLAQLYRQRTGQLPQDFRQMVRAGMLRGIPLDPLGNEYQLDAGGNVFISDPEHFPFVEKALPPGYVPSSTPRIPHTAQ